MHTCCSAPVSSESSSSPDSAAAGGLGSGNVPMCRPLYQSATVDIYARFVMADIRHGSPPYMLHRKALFRLTDLLHDRIRLSDESVARLRGGTVVDGLKPGVTEIQVCTVNMSSSTLCHLLFYLLCAIFVSNKLIVTIEVRFMEHLPVQCCSLYAVWVSVMGKS